jgi:hypothetical protein
MTAIITVSKTLATGEKQRGSKPSIESDMLSTHIVPWTRYSTGTASVVSLMLPVVEGSLLAKAQNRCVGLHVAPRRVDSFPPGQWALKGTCCRLCHRR